MSGERRQALRRVAHPGGRGRLRMPAMTISRRLALAAAGAVAIAVVLASFGAYFAVRSKLLDEVDSTLRQRARLIQRFAPSAAVDAHHVLQGRRPRLWPPPGGKVPPPPPTVSRFGGAAGVVQLVTPAGEALRPLGQKGAELPVDASTLAVARGNSPTTIQHETVDHSRLGVLTAPLAHGGAVEIALPLAQVESTLSGLIELLAAIAAGGVALAALLGLIVARTSLAPVRRFTTSTERIASGRGPPGARLSASAPDELGRLARSYNATLEALERSVIAQRQLVSDASHELRTPLASLRANLELMMSADDVSDEERREINADLVEQVDELTRLIEEIVELARSGEQPGPFVRVPLQGVVLAAVELVEPHAASVRFKLDLARAGTACGERHGLVVAVRNLLENAVKWSPPDGVVEVRAEATSVEVCDHGPGIAAEDLPHVFERFYRARGSRSMPGSGLGLAIVRQVADAHGAKVSAANAPDGGAVMRLTLPLAVAGHPDAACERKADCKREAEDAVRARDAANAASERDATTLS